MLELRYGVISREKRQRLQAGKGVKKNGMYIHDRAASFESLPPGPDPKSVSKDIHTYLPKLTKRGTLFRATQATVDQRQNEFSALVEAFFREDVPSLIRELREDRIIRDFFGYWRRDHDLEAKSDRQQLKADAISRSFIPSFYSTSSVSLSQSRPAQPSEPPSPCPRQTSRLGSLRRRPKTADSAPRSSDTGSLFSGSTLIVSAPSPPSSAPGCLGTTFRDSSTSEDGHHILERKTSNSSSQFSSSLSSSLTSSSCGAPPHRRVNSHRAKSSSPRTETFNVTSDFPLFLSSSSRDLLPSARPPHSPTYVTPGLGTLPEVTEPRPSLRRQKDSSVSPDYAKRNGVVWRDTDEVSSSDGDVIEQELLTPVDGAAFHLAVAKSTSSSSLQSSIAMTNLSLQSRRSSSRTSCERAPSRLTGANDSRIDLDFPLVPDIDSCATFENSIPPPTTSGSRPFYGSRRRSLSQPLPFIPPVPIDVEEEEWSDHGEDIMEAYFGGPDPFFSPSEVDELAHSDGISSEVSHDFPYDPPDSPSVTGFPTPRQKLSYIDGPPVAFHRPWNRTSLSPTLSPRMSTTSLSTLPSLAGDETLVVKAVLDDAIIVFRADRDASLAELRRRVHEKFVLTEGAPLRGAFTLAYVPPVAGVDGKRVSSASSMSTSAVDWARAMPLRNEGDWANVVAGCGSRVTLRVSYRAAQ